VRFGVMHRNTYINSPKLLDNTFKFRDGLWFSGQITGVEGYVESAASGLLAGINAAAEIGGKSPLILPKITALGALAAYVSNPAISSNFQPMNINFGIMEPLNVKIRDKKQKTLEISKRSLKFLEEYVRIKI